MVVDVFGLKFPAQFALSAVKVDSNWHIATVIVLFEQGCLMFLNVAFENSRTGYLNKVKTLVWGFYLAGAKDEVLPPRPIFFDILKVDNC